MPLHAILFDIDDTLYSTTEFAEQARRNSIEAMIRMGLDIDFDTAFKELLEVIAEFRSNYDHHYDKLLRRLPWKALGGVNPALLVAAGVVAYHETKFRQLRPFRDAEEALRCLSEKTELVLGVLTEGLEIKQAEKLIRLGVVKYLDPRALFISDQVGISKPNPKLFRYALDRLGFTAGQVMYVGDNPVRDIVPAKEVGMIAVRHRGTGKYSAEENVVAPDHEIHDFHELLALLEGEYGISC
ncbi:MAG: TIGR02253 family HAD-type hydrolase [Planctomycetota bacterium]